MNIIGNIKNITVDAFVLPYKRPHNLAAVVRGIRRQSFVDNIYLFHNHPSQKKVTGVINVFSEKNFGCIARHALALLSRKKYVLFVDDDIELMADFSQRFKRAINKEPKAVVGLFGCDIDRTVEKERLYMSGGEYQCSKFCRYIDIVKGRVHLCRRENLVNSFEFITKNQQKLVGLREDDFIMDDIILNLANQLRTNIPGLIIPVRENEIKNLDEKDALSFKNNHIFLRSLLVYEFLKKGWKPKANQGKFLQWNIKNGGVFLKREKSIKNMWDFVNKRKLEPASQEYKKIKKKSLVPSHLLYNFAGLYRDKGAWAFAKKIYIYLVKKQKKETKYKALAFFQLGMAFLQEKKQYKARQYFVRCLYLMPDHKKAAWQLRQIS